MTLLAPPALAERAGWVEISGERGELLEVPRGCNTTYLTHGLFRYAGKASAAARRLPPA